MRTLVESENRAVDQPPQPHAEGFRTCPPAVSVSCAVHGDVRGVRQRPLRVVTVHNYYQEPGGEDRVFEAESELLERHGHSVHRYAVHNDAIAHMGRARLATSAVWNRTHYRRLKEVFESYGPDVVHVHNTLPLISPAVYYAARTSGAAVVQTLHNYRLACPSGLLFRDGKPCELCLGRSTAWPGVVHACYRGSRAATAVVAATVALHRARGTYRTGVDRYIALTHFARDTFVRSGISAAKIAVKPNFVAADPGMGNGDGGYALFVGRLSEQKGVRLLLETWEHIGGRLPLHIVGDGPIRDEVLYAARRCPGIQYLGQLGTEDVFREMRHAAVLVIPSRSYETFGLVGVEAFAAGTPVIASRLGALEEIVDHGRTGFTFDVDDPRRLVETLTTLLDRTDLLPAMRHHARNEYERLYTPDRNYEALMTIYGQALEARSNRSA